MSRFHQLRQSLYYVRLRRPISRFLAAALFIVVWPLRSLILRFMNLFLGNGEAKGILVIHLGGLGDTLMLTPAVAALRNRYPHTKIDFITLHQYVKQSFESHSQFNEIKVLPVYPGQWIIEQFANHTGVRLLFATIRFYPGLLLKLAFRRYDVGINFGLSEFDRCVGNAFLFCLNVRTRIGLRDENAGLLTNALDLNFRKTHRVDAYLSFLRPLGIVATNHRYQYTTRDTDSKKAWQTLRDEDVDPSRPLAIIHPGGKLHINSRRWPAEYFARVCRFLCDEGFEVLVTGDSDDALVCVEVARGAGNSAKSIAGQLNFSETAALMKRCELVITNDTATLHLAEAMTVPRVVSIFGPTDSALLAPQNERHLVFRSNLPCAPCMGGIIDAKTERCSRDVKEECLLQTTPEQVIGVLRTFYGERAVRVAGA